jgi:hypothetical protein
MVRRTARNRTDAPKMSAHHFEYLAYVLRTLPYYATTADVDTEAVARVFAHHLKATSPRFCPDTFVGAVLED